MPPASVIRSLYVALFYDDLIRQLQDKGRDNPDPEVVVAEDGQRYRVVVRFEIGGYAGGAYRALFCARSTGEAALEA